MKLKQNDFRKIVVATFLAVPALSSLISTIHIVEFFGLGNRVWMAIILALAFEIGSIASLMTLAVLDKINKFAVWFIFFVLLMMQMLGNVYYTYDFISLAMTSNPTWIQSFVDLVEMMTMQKLEPRTTKFILSLLIGLPIPIISLAFLKSVSDYLKPENDDLESSSNPVLEDEEPKNIKQVKEIDIIEDKKTEYSDITYFKTMSQTDNQIEDESIEDVEDVEDNVEEISQIEGTEEIIENDVDAINIENNEDLSEISSKVDDDVVVTESDIYDNEDETKITETFFDDENEIEKNDNFVSDDLPQDIDEKKNPL